MRNLAIFADEYANLSEHNQTSSITNQPGNSSNQQAISAQESITEDINETTTIVIQQDESNLRFSKISSSENKLSNSAKSIQLLRVTLTTWSALFLVIDMTSWI